VPSIREADMKTGKIFGIGAFMIASLLIFTTCAGGKNKEKIKVWRSEQEFCFEEDYKLLENLNFEGIEDCLNSNSCLEFLKLPDPDNRASALFCLFLSKCTDLDERACTWLAYIFSDDRKYFKRDYTKMLFYGDKGCRLGHPAACSLVATAYRIGIGLLVDHYQSFDYAYRACLLNDAMACSDLGAYYNSGIGIEKDELLALDLYRSACDHGAGVGCSNFANAIWNKVVTLEELSELVTIVEKGVLFNDPWSDFTMGNIFLNGKGVEEDSYQAAFYFNTACEKKLGNGCLILAELLVENGFNKESDSKICDLRTRGLEFVENQCLNNGHGPSCKYMGEIYSLGVLLPKDISIARDYFSIACMLNEEEACTNLVNLS
jgi:TPR repeat protein